MVHAAVRAGGAAGGAVPGRIRRRRLDLATTPGRLWLVLIGLVALSLAWGALSAFTAVQYSSAASSVVHTREQLSLAAQQIYSRLSDADDAAATAFLTTGPEPPHQAAVPGRHRRGEQHDRERHRPGRRRHRRGRAGPRGARHGAAGLRPGDRQRRRGQPARPAPGRGLPAGSLWAHARHAAREGQGPVRGREREPERYQRPGHRAAAHRGHARRRPSLLLPAGPGVTLAERAHQPGAQRRPGRRGRLPRRLGGLAGRRLPGGQERPD